MLDERREIMCCGRPSSDRRRAVEMDGESCRGVLLSRHSTAKAHDAR